MRISIDVREVANEFNLMSASAEVMTKQVLDDITNEFIRNWKIQAKNRLHSTRDEYLNSIVQVESGRLKNVVALIGQLPNMLEFGVQPFDLKQGFSQGKKVKLSKNGGWYLTIPFRFATPGALGESEVFNGGVLPNEVYRILKNQAGRKTSVGGGSSPSHPIAFSQLPQQHQPKKKTLGIASNAITGIGFGSYTHKTPIFQGVVRNEKTYERANQSKYSSFRRVSNNSDPNSWIHTGLEAQDLANAALNSMNLETIVNNSVDRFLSNL